MNATDRDMFIAVGLTIATAIFRLEYNSVYKAESAAEDAFDYFSK